MFAKEKTDRINFLAKKAKTEGLTAQEKKEQSILREEFLANFRRRFKQQLDNIQFVEDIEEEKKCVEKNNVKH